MASLSKWHRHISALNPTKAMQGWLAEEGSLTARLQNHCKTFQVTPTKQRKEVCLMDDCKPLALSRPKMTPVREVLLYCDEQPVVFAHTAVMPRAAAINWPMFKTLGNSSLGSLLFSDAKITRSKSQFSRIKRRHPLAKRIYAALPELIGTSSFYARRCLYRRNRGAMLVTEIFLPGITHLRATHKA